MSLDSDTLLQITSKELNAGFATKMRNFQDLHELSKLRGMSPRISKSQETGRKEY